MSVKVRPYSQRVLFLETLTSVLPTWRQPTHLVSTYSNKYPGFRYLPVPTTERSKLSTRNTRSTAKSAQAVFLEPTVDSEVSLSASEEGNQRSAFRSPDSEVSSASSDETETKEDGEEISAAALQAEVSQIGRAHV